ncbi:MAG: phage scaffolding protein [Lactobacillus sp.]|uniref:phage scaffolding protein n=1 Tax=Lactobacillus sp. TaxID=1591 RepID=UPI0023BDB858|nr:phage scaffolding protein [Lactobacillus sp.]MDE7049554.1 phage scaffolding protein [Lactobacillus sp.]
MERDFLKKLGIDDDAVKKIMLQYGKDIRSYEDKLNENKTTIDGLNEQLSQRDIQLKDLGTKAEDNEKLKERVEEYKAKNAELSKEWQGKLDAQSKNFAISNSLRDAGAKNSKAVSALLDLDKVSLDDKGKLTGLDDQVEALKKSDGYLFTSNETEDAKPKDGIKIFSIGNPVGDQKQNDSLVSKIARNLQKLD